MLVLLLPLFRGKLKRTPVRSGKQCRPAAFEETGCMHGGSHVFANVEPQFAFPPRSGEDLMLFFVNDDPLAIFLGANLKHNRGLTRLDRRKFWVGGDIYP